MKIFSPKHLRVYARLVSLFLLVLYAAKLARRATDTFTILGISSSRPYNSLIETRPLSESESEELQDAISQRYRYQERGGQVYVFFSEDGKYVVKFLYQHRFKPSWLLNHIPLPRFLHQYRHKHNLSSLIRLRKETFSYRTSFDVLKHMTGVIYCHLNKTDTLKKPLEIIDRLGIHHYLDLDQFDFIVQKRAVKAYNQIDTWMAIGNVEAAKQGIRAIFSMLSEQALVGFRDRDAKSIQITALSGIERLKSMWGATSLK